MFGETNRRDILTYKVGSSLHLSLKLIYVSQIFQCNDKCYTEKNGDNTSGRRKITIYSQTMINNTNNQVLSVGYQRVKCLLKLISHKN